MSHPELSDTDAERVEFLVVGAGMTGLAFARFVDSDDYLILERDQEIGGYCKTIKQDGFVWDYSGHFFHFRHPDIEAMLRRDMPADEIRTVTKNAKILFDGDLIDFPFQRNIHQLKRDDFLACLHDLYFRPDGDYDSFHGMLLAKFGEGISRRFLIPYNEKLYACDLNTLDPDAMGRFFPYANIDEVVRQFKEADNNSYNATFTYPRGGAIRYIEAMLAGVNQDKLVLGDGLKSLCLKTKVATTNSGRRIRFEHLVSTAPLDKLVAMCGLHAPKDVLSANEVLVFNLGFDKKGWEGVHWVYIPDKNVPFYRVGFYDNIFDESRMSLYVEVGRRPGETRKNADTEQLLEAVLNGLKRVGIVADHRLVSHHSVVLNPAYAHIKKRSIDFVEATRKKLATRGVYTIGRYGGWTYCSIEDNIVEARALAERFALPDTLEGRGE